MRRTHAPVEGRGDMSALDQLREAIRHGAHRITGTGTRMGFLPQWQGSALDVTGMTGIVQHDVDDQVVEVWAGTPVLELQAALRSQGQCLPFATDEELPQTVRGDYGTVGGLLAMALPHALVAQCGGPRDWTLGMTVVRTDGTVAKSGSKAVKSVAGYDAHKLFIGSRGSLGVIAKAVLRTYPVKALPGHRVKNVRSFEGSACTVVRTTRTEFDSHLEITPQIIAADPESSTLWVEGEPEPPLEGWMVSPEGRRWRSCPVGPYEARALQVFDPDGRLAQPWSD